MKERGWTVERLASQMTGRNGQKGITQSAASQIINGNPTLATLQEIADIIGVLRCSCLPRIYQHFYLPKLRNYIQVKSYRGGK